MCLYSADLFTVMPGVDILTNFHEKIKITFRNSDYSFTTIRFSGFTEGPVSDMYNCLLNCSSALRE